MTNTKKIQHDPPGPEQAHHAPELERRFLRLGVEGMEAERFGCTRCGRSPLVGERLRVYESADGESQLCDICVAESGNALPEQPVRTVRMRASERRLKIVDSRAA